MKPSVAKCQDIKTRCRRDTGISRSARLTIHTYTYLIMQTLNIQASSYNVVRVRSWISRLATGLHWPELWRDNIPTCIGLGQVELANVTKSEVGLRPLCCKLEHYILLSNSHNFVYYAHTFYLIYSKLCQIEHALLL